MYIQLQIKGSTPKERFGKILQLSKSNFILPVHLPFLKMAEKG
jgi:hypothetical protein